ncbi:MAG: SPASM domain-containing protein [Bacteriovorax sp.]|nr:SPASM domain-containing protein [Bacteriovorax sp.]
MPMYCFDLNTPFKLRIDEIQKDEFVYFKLPEALDDGLDSYVKTIIDSLTKQTSRLFFSINDTSKYLNLAEIEEEFPIAWFGVPVEVGSNQKGVHSEHSIYSNIDSLSLIIFEAQKLRFKNQKKIIPEFIITDNYYQLAPTIVEFFNRFKLPFAFITIEGVPDPKRVNIFHEIFESLRIKGFKEKIYFSFNNPNLDEWNIKTHNSFSGLQTVHIDLSNKCTHSCVFCGIWGPEFIDDMKSRSNGILSEETVNFMNRQMPHQRALEILESLPDTIQTVQFGGSGDPLTHPNWLDIISRWRSRGLIVEVLTNFEYPNHLDLEVLHQLSKGRKNFSFLINLSAATAETYKAIRPRQSNATFEKVISNIRYSSNLRKQDGHGISITIINIINSQNFREAVKMIELAHELGVGVWLKPLEVHSSIHQKYTIAEEDYPLFLSIMSQALQRADELKVNLVFREFLKTIIEDHQASDETKFEKSQLDFGSILNGQVPGVLYQTIPCTVAFTYVRFEVNGSVKPCCISPFQMGNINDANLDEIWHSHRYYAWREKFLKIQTTRFHLKDNEYGFCQICPHIPINLEASKLLSIKRD